MNRAIRVGGWAAVTLLVMAAGSGCVRRGLRGDTAKPGEVIEGRIDEDSPKWEDEDGDRSAIFTVHAKQYERFIIQAHVVGQTQSESGTPNEIPQLFFVQGARTLAQGEIYEDTSSSYMDALAPEEGDYQVVFNLGDALGEYTLKIQRDAELPTSRAGKFALVHADQEHAWFVDLATYKRQGDVASFAFIEVTSQDRELGGEKLHSLRYDDELNCAGGTARTVKTVARLGRPDERQTLREVPLTEEQGKWVKSGSHGDLRALVCDEKNAAQRLQWPDLDVAIAAFENAKVRNQDEAPGDKAGKPENGSPSPELRIGQTVQGALQKRGRRYAGVWPFDQYRFKVKQDQKFEVQVAAAFRPYVRLRSGGDVLVSTFDAMADGVAVPLGSDLEADSEVEVVVEVTSFEDPLGGAYSLTLKELPAGPPFGGLKLRQVDLDQVLMQTAGGRDALAKLAQWKQEEERALDAEESELQERMEEYEKMKPVFSQEAMKKRLEELQDQADAHKARVDRRDQALKEKKAEFAGPLVEKVKKAAQALAEREGWDLVLFKSDDLLAGRKVEDVTPQLLRALNEGGAP